MALIQAVANDNGAGATTLVATIASSTVGSCLTAIVGRLANLVTGVTDNLAQTYTAAFTPGAFTEAAGAWICPNSAAGVTTITATFSASTGSVIFALEESGIVTASPVDQTQRSTSTSGATYDSGATATTTNANDVGYAIACSAATSNVNFAADAGWTAVTGTGITSGHHGNTTEGDDLFVARREYTATGAYSATGTLTSNTHAGTIVILMQAAVGPAPRITFPTTSVAF